MNLDAVEKFVNGLPVKDRDSHLSVPFIFKFNQKKLHLAAQKQIDAGKPIRLVIDKARRVTASSWTEALLFCHAICLPGSHSLIVAHEFKTSKELFRVPKDFIPAVPFLNIKQIERQLTFPRPSGQDSLIQIITAGKDTSGRGFTLSALHASECAHWVSPDAFISLLPALSGHKETIGVIESTPNGSEGDGEVFHDMYWDAAEGKSEWEAVFLSWTDDPACVAPEEFAKDAPADEEEKELLARGFSKAQLAWRRLKISSPECGGNIDTFHQEYPTTAEESFIASGRPAFTGEEVRWAKKNVRPPKARGFLEKSLEGEFKFREHYKGDLHIWEDPRPGDYYYAGMDAARGIEGRDFSAMVVWNGNTGHQVARYSAYCIPELFATYGASIGRHYNRAMLNPELTGGYGYTVLSMLRDGLKYPNIYFWKGKDDKIAGSKSRMTFGFETTGHMRTVLFEQLRVGLREGSGTAGDYGITIFDDALASQIERCTIKDVRPEVEEGHDDILFGAMLGNIAMRQYAPPRSPNPVRPQADEDMADAIRQIRGRGDTVQYEPEAAMRRHFEMISRLIDHPKKDDEEEVA
jgi:hypothetical protein